MRDQSDNPLQQTEIEIVDTQQEENKVVPYSEDEPVEDLLYEFLRNRSPTTERSYRDDLKGFFAFTKQHFSIPRVDGRSVHFEDIKRVHVIKFKNYLETVNCRTGKPYAPNSINRKIASVASFFKFLQQREVVDKNPVEFLKRPPRTNVRPTEALDEAEIKALFQLVIRRANPLHRSIVLLAFLSGLRNHEIRNIKLRDFEIRDGVKVLKYIGKGQKENVVSIHPAVSYHLGVYVEWMASKGRPIQNDDYLFQATNVKAGSEGNKRLSHSALGYIVKKWSRQINMGKRITPHSCRSSYISLLLSKGCDLYDVAKVVGHSRCDTTALYDRRKKNYRQSPVFKLDLF